MCMELVREAYERELLDYTIEQALELINKGIEKTDLAELYSICSSVMFKKVQYVEAMVYGQKSIEADPSYAAGYSNLGWAEYWLGINDKALKHLNKSCELNPSNAENFYRIGSVYNNALGNFVKAEEALAKAVELNPKSDLAWQQLGICLYNQGKNEESEYNYRKAAELGDAYSAYCLMNNGFAIETADEKIALGRDYWAQNNTQTAIDYFKEALEQGFETVKKTVDVTLELADKLSWMKVDDDAEYWYNNAIEMAPSSAEVYSRRGWFYYCTSKDSEAENDYVKAISLDPENHLFSARLGNLYAVTGQLEKGLETLNPAIDKYPFSPDLYHARALCHRNLGNIADAKSDFVQADFFGSRDALKDRRAKYGDEYAMDFFQAGLEEGNQNYPEAAVKHFDKAAVMFKELIKFNGDLAFRYASKSLHNIGYYLHISGGDNGRAIKVVEEALDMQPHYIDAWGTLGNIYNSHKNSDKAMECYSKMIELQPNEGRGYYSRGRIYLAEKNWDLGTDDFTKAANLYQRQDWRGDAFFNRGRCHEGAGRIKAAIADYEEAFNNGIRQGIQESFRLKDQFNIET